MVEVRYLGRLGNNLFQYCFGRILTENLGFKLKTASIPGFPNTGTQIKGLDYSSYPAQVIIDWEGKLRVLPLEDRNMPLYTFYQQMKTQKNQNIANKQFTDLKDILADKTKRTIVFFGYFQLYKYYMLYKKVIRNDWLLMDSKCRSPYRVSPEDIAVHIRTGETKQNDFLTSFSYYKEALDIANYQRLFIVVDHPLHPFLRFFKQYKPIVCHSSTSFLEDFVFLTQFNKIILSPSTFGWWAAFLSKAKEIYFPIQQEGYWADKNNSVDLKVDESRYNYIKCK